MAKPGAGSWVGLSEAAGGNEVVVTSGTVGVTGVATEATLAAIQTLIDSLATLAETQPVSLASVPSHAVTGPVTDAQLRASAVPVSIAAAVALDAGSLAALETIGLDAATLAALESITVVDGGASLTVDAPVGTPVFVRLSDGSAAIATLPVSLASLPALAAGSANIGDVDIASVATGQGKTLLFGAITQGAAGTTQLVAADATKKVKIASYTIVMDAAGSVKFTDGTVDLSGVMPMAANGGVAQPGQPAGHLLETAAINRPLNIVTVTGKAFGHFSYFLEA